MNVPKLEAAHLTHEDPGCFTPSQASDRAALAIGWKVLSGPCQNASARGWSRRADSENYCNQKTSACACSHSASFVEPARRVWFARGKGAWGPAQSHKFSQWFHCWLIRVFPGFVSLCLKVARFRCFNSISKASWMCFVDFLWLNSWSRGASRFDVDGFPSPFVVTK